MTDACLKRDGNVLDSIDKLTVSVRTGSKISKHALSKMVGMGSRLHDLEFPSVITFLSSSVVTGLNSDSVCTLLEARDTGV